jgi:hypothetical protein
MLMERKLVKRDMNDMSAWDVVVVLMVKSVKSPMEKPPKKREMMQYPVLRIIKIGRKMRIA